MMKFSLSYIVVFVVTVCSLIAQEDQDYKIRMRKAVDNSNFNLALQIYAGAEQDDYYDMESLQRNVITHLMSCQRRKLFVKSFMMKRKTAILRT